LIESEPIGGRTRDGQQDLEENDFKYTEDLGDDKQQVPHPTQPHRILLDML
jgi:hypothetical protein